MTAGVSGRRDRVATVEEARGRVSCVWATRQGAVPRVLFGGMVRVIAYDKRR